MAKTVRALIEELQKLPPEAHVYISFPPDDWNCQGWEEDPDPRWEDDQSIYVHNRQRAHPHGRVKL